MHSGLPRIQLPFRAIPIVWKKQTTAVPDTWRDRKCLSPRITQWRPISLVSQVLSDTLLEKWTYKFHFFYKLTIQCMNNTQFNWFSWHSLSSFERCLKVILSNISASIIEVKFVDGTWIRLHDDIYISRINSGLQ